MAMPDLARRYGAAAGRVALALCVLAGSTTSTMTHAQERQTSGTGELSGKVPPPDESHAMHRIETCGGRHFDPRLQLCDVRDQRLYRVIRIGDQVWMAENLNFGVAVPGSRDQLHPGEKYCLHDAGANCAALYQWAEAVGLDPSFNAKAANLKGSVRGVCPQNWHLPSSAEWAALLAFVDKEQGADHEAMSLMYYSHNPDFQWKTNTNPDDVLPSDRYGFEVVSTGIRVLRGGCPVGQAGTSYFCNAHDRAFFWTSDDRSADGDPLTAVDYVFTEDIRQAQMENIAHDPVHPCDPARFGARGCSWKRAQKVYGMAVRCIADQSVGGGSVTDAALPTHVPARRKEERKTT